MKNFVISLLAATAMGISNLAWGDDNRKTIYTTGGTMVTRIRVKVAGLRP
jgi:hypothetical protein